MSRPEPREPGLFDRTAGDAAGGEPPPLSVSALTARIKGEIESLGRVRVEGELTGLKVHHSGHWYFALKDQGAVLACAIWKSQVGRAVKLAPEELQAPEGLAVVATGRLDVYAPRGTYSLIVERLEVTGAGILLARLEALKAELKALGWFDRKRPIPELPRVVGVVTSRDGAALQDFLKTRSARWPLYPVRLAHSPVQGRGAADEISAAIRRLDASGVDVICVIRGGGSLEDLWAFNERAVAQAIWESRAPVVSGVGHESDVTLIDWVADRRAHTPTAAAEAVIPDRELLLTALDRLRGGLIDALDGALARREDALARCAARRVLASPRWILGERREALLRAASGLKRGAARGADLRAVLVARLETRVARHSPRAELARAERRLALASALLAARGRVLPERGERRLELAAGKLEAMSPLAVLKRGYALVTKDGRGVRAAADLVQGDAVAVVFARGRARARVEAVEPGPADGGGS